MGLQVYLPGSFWDISWTERSGTACPYQGIRAYYNSAQDARVIYSKIGTFPRKQLVQLHVYRERLWWSHKHKCTANTNKKMNLQPGARYSILQTAGAPFALAGPYLPVFAGLSIDALLYDAAPMLAVSESRFVLESLGLELMPGRAVAA